MFEGHLSHQKLHRPGKTWEGWNSVIRMDRQDLSTGQARRSTLQQSSSANLAPWPAVYGCITSFRAKNFSKQRRDGILSDLLYVMHFTSSNKALVVYLASNLRRATAWNFHEPIFVMDEFAWAKKTDSISLSPLAASTSSGFSALRERLQSHWYTASNPI